MVSLLGATLASVIPNLPRQPPVRPKQQVRRHLRDVITFGSPFVDPSRSHCCDVRTPSVLASGPLRTSTVAHVLGTLRLRTHASSSVPSPSQSFPQMGWGRIGTAPVPGVLARPGPRQACAFLRHTSACKPSSLDGAEQRAMMDKRATGGFRVVSARGRGHPGAPATTAAGRSSVPGTSGPGILARL